MCKISAQRLQFELLSVTLGIGFVNWFRHGARSTTSAKLTSAPS